MSTVAFTAIKDLRITLLRLEVDPDSVSFTSFGDTSVDPEITEQLRLVLVHRLGVMPHPLVNDFAADRFRSLVAPSGESGVCHPLALGPSAPTGSIASIQQLLLAGRDLAVAVSREHVLSQVQPSLDALKAAPPPPFTVSAWWFTGTYTVSIGTATATWSALATPPPGFDPVGVITLTIGGAATTGSIFPNASFSVTHDLWALFDPATETLTVVSGGPPAVSAHVNGIFGGLVHNRVGGEVTKAYNNALGSMLAQATAKLQGALAQKQKLVTQIKTLDAAGDAHFESAESLADGFILRGRIELSPRHGMLVKVEALPDYDGGYTALHSWVPGGYIVNYQWRWYLTTGPISAGTAPDGSDSFDDRFILKPTSPDKMPGMPIYDGSGDPPHVPWGQICVIVKGFVLDPVTGLEHGVDNFSAVFRERQCLYVVPPVPVVPAPLGARKIPRRWWSLWAVPAGSGGGAADHRVAAYVEAPRGAAPAFNVLLHYLHDRASTASLVAVATGIRDAARADAGLLVAVVLRAGLLEDGGPEMTAALGSFAERLGYLPMVTEDVQEGWASDLGAPGPLRGTSTTIVDASGRKAWQHEGPADAATIAAALRAHLRPSPAPRATLVQPAVGTGQMAPRFFIEPSAGEWLELGHLHGRRVVVTFIQAWARPCVAQLRRLERLQERFRQSGVTTVALVDDASPEAARAFARDHRLSFTVSADPDGAVARSFGISAWPTTVMIDEEGRITDVEVGADGGALDALAREAGVGREPR